VRPVSGATTLAVLAFGFMLGLRHATEPDHVVAVSTIVSERRSLLKAATVGVYWGLGHTASLLVVGLLAIGAGIMVPESIASRLELGVAAMIVLLGASLLRSALAPAAAPDDGHRMAHSGEAHASRIGWKPLIVGMIHGLAGSAALIVLIQAELAREASGLLGIGFLLLFGVGSIAGMLAMGTVISLPFVLSAGSVAPLRAYLQRLAGAGSVLFGLYYGWQAW